MPCRIYRLDFQEKNLNQGSDLEIRGSNPGPGSNFSLENLIWKSKLKLVNELLKAAKRIIQISPRVKKLSHGEYV